MMRLLRSRRFWVGLTATIGFLPLIFMPRNYLFDLVNALTVAAGVGVLIAYFPGICKSMREERWDGNHYLVMGIFVTWLATAMRHLWNWIWRFIGKPPEMIDHQIVAFLVWMYFLGGIMHLSAKGALDGEIPKATWIRMGITVAAGVALGLLVILFLEPAHAPVTPRIF
jgi:hypothetical protein